MIMRAEQSRAEQSRAEQSRAERNQRIQKLIFRVRSIFLDFLGKTFHFGFHVGWNHLKWWFYYYRELNGEKMKLVGKEKQKLIEKWLKVHCSDLWHTYIELNQSSIPRPSSRIGVPQYPIWFCWLQGIENAPEIVQVCYKNIIRNNENDVILLTDNNIKEYIDIPVYIIEKRERGIIPFANYADIVRVALLAQYGGLWIDATCWTTCSVPDFVKKCPVYSRKDSEQNPTRGYLLGSSSAGNRFFTFVRDAFFEYWKVANYNIDWLLIDNLMHIAQDYIPSAQKDLHDMPIDNLKCTWLFPLLNHPFNLEEYKKLTNNTWCFKLSHKCILNRYDNEGSLTYWGWISNQTEEDK